MTDFVAKASGRHSFELGEGPVWNPTTGRLSMVDIFQRRVHMYTMSPSGPMHIGEFETEGDVGAALPLVDNQFLLCENHGIFLRRSDGSRELVTKLPVSGSEFRCNDAKIGPDGKLWVGIMDYDASEGKGSLWRISPNGESQLLLGNLTIPNGLDWLGSEFWFVNGPTEEIRCYRWNEKELVDSGRSFKTNGTPDGLTFDSNGEMWLALWGEGRVDHYDSSGQVMDSVAVASPHSTSLCFAGENLDTLVMTSAKFAMTEEAISAHPNCGDLFVAQPGVTGRGPNLQFK